MPAQARQEGAPVPAPPRRAGVVRAPVGRSEAEADAGLAWSAHACVMMRLRLKRMLNMADEVSVRRVNGRFLPPPAT